MNARTALLASTAAAFVACTSLHRVRVEPIALEASALFQKARVAIREGGPHAREEARAAAEEALEAAPGWVAPARLLDDLLVDDLLAVEALGRHRASLAAMPSSAFHNYLAGRLEGVAGVDRFRRAVKQEPELAWGHHGLAWSRAREGDFAEAVEHEVAALQRARDGFERAFFSQALARFALADDRAEDAVAVLERALRDPWLTQIDRIELELQAVEIELSFPSLAQARAGYQRGLSLLRRGDLTESEVALLGWRLRRHHGLHDRDALELQLALASHAGPAADALRAELLLQNQPTPLALALLERAAAQSGTAITDVDSTLLRQARFAAGAFQPAFELWLRDLPRQVLDSEGLPRAPSLRAIADALARLETHKDQADLEQLGQALVAAGWFVEARSVAGELALANLTGALALDARALAGLELLNGIERLVASIDRGEGPFEVLQVGETTEGAPWDQEPRKGRADPRSLDSLLAAVARLSEQNPLLEGDPLARQSSPRFDYGPIGELVHPGPLFSAADERAGLGRAGERVPGLARLCDTIGRFGLFGAMSGRGPDGTMLRTVLVEPRSGEHLGTPWSGTVAWCEGADVESRLGDAGATISGAALHEGYWIDLSIVRRQAESFAAFQHRFAGEQNEGRVEAAIGSRGLRLTTPPGLLARRRAERRQVDPLLSQADRVRATVLAERGGLPWSESGAPLVPFEELVEITAIHEEGHLCDRARFLPLRSNLGRALGLLFSAGFTPASVMARLEYRAELTALCSAPDPRLPLIDILRSAESASDVALPHPRAYRELLRDLLEVLDREIERHPDRWSEIDPDCMLVHQLHWIPPEKLRGLALELARDEGLVSN
jgi:hypothetical protein